MRDNYAVGDDRMLMVASDRLSAFDVVMGEPIPGKGALLTADGAVLVRASSATSCPNHLTGDDPHSVVAADEREQVRGRSMLVKRLKPLAGRSRGARLPGRQRLEGIPGRAGRCAA